MKNQPSHPKNDPNEDFWDLGDDDLEIDAPSEEGPVAKESTPLPEKKALVPPEKKGQPAPDAKEVAEDTKPEASPKKSPPLAKKLSKADPSPDPVPESPAPKTEQKRVRVGSVQAEARPTSIIEKILLAALVISLIGVAIWGARAFLDNAPNGTLVEFTESYPAKGEQISIAGVETWWREPLRTGDKADVGVVLEASLIPCAKIILGESNSSSLQVSFRDGEDNLIGDTINLNVENGKFLKNNANEIELHATDGFENPSRINAYVNEDIEPWSVVITEGDGSNEALVRARVEANRKENN